MTRTNISGVIVNPDGEKNVKIPKIHDISDEILTKKWEKNNETNVYKEA